MTPFECDHMYKFSEYFPIEKSDKKPKWVSKIILTSVLKNKTLKGALISDQDIVASNNILSEQKIYQKQITKVGG